MEDKRNSYKPTKSLRREIPKKKKEIKDSDIPEMHEFEFDDVVSILLGVKPEKK